MSDDKKILGYSLKTKRVLEKYGLKASQDRMGTFYKCEDVVNFFEKVVNSTVRIDENWPENCYDNDGYCLRCTNYHLTCKCTHEECLEWKIETGLLMEI